jgi:hypothetical protein
MSLRVRQQPVNGRETTGAERHPLSPCPIVRLSIYGSTRSTVDGGWVESELDLSLVQIVSTVSQLGGTDYWNLQLYRARKLFVCRRYTRFTTSTYV